MAKIKALKEKNPFYPLTKNNKHPMQQTPDTSVDQVAAICYRPKDTSIEFLLIQTDRGRWIFPKGNIEEDEEMWETAQREALEEAGVSGEIQLEPFTTFLHLKERVRQTGIELYVAAYLLRVKATQPPLEPGRMPAWFSPEEAEEVLAKGRQSQYAEELKRVVRQAVALFPENPSVQSVSSVDPKPL